MLLLWFILIVNIRPLSVSFDLLFNLFKIAFAFHLYSFNFSAILIVGVPFPFGV